MKISRNMIREHLVPLTIVYFAHHPIQPSNLGDYAPYAVKVGAAAERAGDLPWFKAGLAYVLSHREEPSEDLNAGTYAFDQEHMLDTLEVIWLTLWPDEPLPEPGSAPKVEWVDVPTDEWLKIRASQGNDALKK